MRGDCDRYIVPAIQTVSRIMEHLQFSTQYQDIGSTQPVWQSLRQVVDRAIGELRPEGIEIVIGLSDLEIFADGLVYRVIYALIENTLRHSAGATRIQIRSEKREDDTLILVFGDNGRGIEDGDKDHIFRYGYGNHTGLGLAISRDILALTGFTIRETGISGKGARFEISIPSSAWQEK